MYDQRGKLCTLTIPQSGFVNQQIQIFIDRINNSNFILKNITDCILFRFFFSAKAEIRVRSISFKTYWVFREQVKIRYSFGTIFNLQVFLICDFIKAFMILRLL